MRKIFIKRNDFKNFLNLRPIASFESFLVIKRSIGYPNGLQGRHLQAARCSAIPQTNFFSSQLHISDSFFFVFKTPLVSITG